MLRYRVSASEEERIRAVSARENLSMSAWVRRVVIKELDRVMPEAPPQDDDHAW